MFIKDYYQLLKKEDLVKECSENAPTSDKEIITLAYHTAKVTTSTLFICKGKRFKEEYVLDAVKNGAILLVSEEKYNIDNVEFITVKDVRRAMSLLSEFHYDFPQNKLFKVGITGTKGKTTTAFCYKTINDEYTASLSQMPTAIFSSICNYYGKETEESYLTTPESPDLFRYMAQAVDSNIKDLVMEASSQGLKYNRLDGVEFDIGIFLNISEDHISPLEHTDFDDYFEAKKRIADISRVLLLNADVPEHTALKERFKKNALIFSLENENADYYGYHIRTNGQYTSFFVKSKNFNCEFTMPMKGDFNVSNAIAAIAAADIKGIPVHIIQRGIAKAHVEGRMDWVSSFDEKINAVIDFAHNKLSFETLFDYLKKEYPEKSIVVVFGCSGEKSYDRRKVLPEISAKYCKHMYITTMNSGPEPFEKIVSEIIENIPEGAEYTVIKDRSTAIYDALDKFGESSIVVIAGRGRKKTHRTENGYEPYLSDYDCARQYVTEYNKKQGN